jgi:dienelactone hydrolase
MPSKPVFIAISAVGWLLAPFFVPVYPSRAQERETLPVQIDGEAVKLATIIYKPVGKGPFPVLIFHHGSTGSGTDPAIFKRPYDAFALAHWFQARGWAVVLPSRRGRGGSEGIYDEGFSTERSQGYTCDETRTLAGAERALRDIDAATAVILALPFVDRTRFLVGGHSRGGILSIAWAGRHPEEPRGVVNFVGGWLGARCSTASAVNQHLFNIGAAFHRPTLWLYSDHDRFYPLAHSRENFESFRAARGEGSFHEVKEPTAEVGHRIDLLPELWSKTMESYLGERGLPSVEQ